jgi:hypothetical protein
MGSLMSDIKMTDEINNKKFNTGTHGCYYVGGSETGNVIRDAIIEDGYFRKSNVKTGVLVQDNLLGSN